MGQPKRKQSKRRSALRRGANQFKAPLLAKDADGSAIRPHRVNPATGTYRGRKVVEVDL
ncbi:MAG TPA: 50S ribosomal protein L32 [Candidatus Spyradosoma merdigallinarum]|uniref:Large ribosomal subunit protein bL32 n=1 Tax=Candidatus Spyradosoma merdigallinarum TaxID=2840950 RepID=A0A9D1NIQ4_9BACT|nr:50S ribosomal protein L32 [Candidatus Spyradosoma merdigallinarum]